MNSSAVTACPAELHEQAPTVDRAALDACAWILRQHRWESRLDQLRAIASRSNSNPPPAGDSRRSAASSSS